MQNHGLEFNGTKDVEAQMLRDIRELKYIVRVTTEKNLNFNLRKFLVLINNFRVSPIPVLCFW